MTRGRMAPRRCIWRRRRAARMASRCWWTKGRRSTRVTTEIVRRSSERKNGIKAPRRNCSGSVAEPSRGRNDCHQIHDDNRQPPDNLATAKRGRPPGERSEAKALAKAARRSHNVPCSYKMSGQYELGKRVQGKSLFPRENSDTL